jgi:uncharacterized FAD-dependent dehydrogenase
VITNGMSRFRRDSPYANSAVVVNVRVDDLEGENPLAGLAFRRHWEERSFLAGGIINSALDGIRAAERLIDSLGN